MIARTTCKFCASRCGMLLHLEGEKLIRIEGDSAHPVSRGWSCARGRAATAKSVSKELGPVRPRL